MRQFKQAAGFAATAAVTLGIGIGSVVAMFSVYARVVLNPVSFDRPDTLVEITTVNRNVKFVPSTLSWPRFELIRRESTTLDQLTAFSNESVNISGVDGPPEQLKALRVSGAFFEAFRLSAARGRVFAPGDDLPNGPHVCILTSELWQARFGGREIVGAMLDLNGRPTEVVGILPPQLSPPFADRQILLPRVFDDFAIAPASVATGASYIQVAGRLRHGVTLAQAAGEMQRLSQAYATEFAGNSDVGSEAAARPLVDGVIGNRRGVLSALLAGVAIVLLVACLNTAALLVSRFSARQRETAVRRALGASRWSIVGLFLRESLVLAGAAGMVGVALASALLTAFQAVFADQLPPGVILRINPPALLAAVILVFVSALLVGAVPALHATRPSSTSPLLTVARGMSSGAGGRRFRGALVVWEVTLSVCLLVGASLLLASLHRLQRFSPGFDASGVAAGFTSLPADRYRTRDMQAAFFLQVVERLTDDPQVEGAAVVFGLPFHDENFASSYAVAGRPVPPLATRARAGLRAVTEDYFRVMRIPLRAGRAFTADDRAGGPGVCIVNESLARRRFAGMSAIGQVLLRGREANQRFEIVGVVADVKTNGVRQDTPDEVFLPFRQLPQAQAAVVARTRTDPDTLAPLFRAAVQAVDPTLPIFRFASMERRLAGTLGAERLMAGLSTAFAAIALVLAAVGLYAVLAHNVSTRTIEIGIRMALGADRRAVLFLVLAQGMRLVVVGIACGLLAAVAAARLLASQLFEISPWEPLPYLVVAVVFAAVGAAACVMPARRATHVDPIASLRTS